jgi:hypothetical protein
MIRDLRSGVLLPKQYSEPARRLSMRVTYLILAAFLVLPLGACAGSQQGTAHPGPPPVKREMLVGNWGATDPFQVIQQIEFVKDGTTKTIFKAMPEAVPGKYSWVDDRLIVLEFQPSDSARKAFQAMAKAHRETVKKMSERRLGADGAERVAAAHWPQLPDKETLHIGMAENQLLLTTEKDVKLSFDRK